MKMMYKMLLFFICLNMATYLVNHIATLTNMPTEGINPAISPSEVEQDFNASQTVSTWKGWANPVFIFGDIAGGLAMMWQAVQTFFIGFPMFLSSFGVPSVIISVLAALWAFIWGWAIFEWITGRRASPE